MTLEELLNAVRLGVQAEQTARLVERARRNAVILVHLDKLGFRREDGWGLDEKLPHEEGVTISHKDLPRSVLAFLSSDGRDTLYISLGTYGARPADAWEIAQEMGATLSQGKDVDKCPPTN